MNTAKQELRREMRRRLAELTSTERLERSRQIARHLAGWEPWRKAQTVGLFASRADEPELSLLREEAWLAGKRVFYPRVEDMDLIFRLVSDPGELIVGTLGLLEPDVSAIAEVPELILVPGLAFDFAGGRLGRGKGFYDRYLAAHPVLKVGLGFAFQMLVTVPMEPPDVRMDWLLSDDGIRPAIT